MPATSSKQKRFMDAAAHNPVFAKKAGVPVSVAKDFSKASKGAKFGSSGTRADSQVVNRPDTNQGKSELFSKGGNTMASKMNPGMMAMMAKKKDGMHKMPDGKMMKNSAMKKGGMATGGETKKTPDKKGFFDSAKDTLKQGAMQVADDIHYMTGTERGKNIEKSLNEKYPYREKGMKTGGVTMGNAGGYKAGGMPMVMKDGKKVPAFAADGQGKMKNGGMTKKMNMGGMAKGGGIETKGKTKGTMIKMKSGGRAC